MFGTLTGHGVEPKTLPAEVIRELPSKDRENKYIYITDPELLKIIGERFKESPAADEPQFGNLAAVPFFPAATTDTAYFRFHGRNKKNWLKKGIDTSLRYDYVYSEEEIREFVPHILDADRKGNLVFAMFNNCH